MTRTREQGTGAVRLAFEGEMTIYVARRDRDRLLEALSSASSLAVNLSQVTEIDTAGVQLLLALKAECARRELPVTLEDHSPAVLQALDAYELSAAFGDPVVLSAAAT